MNVTLNQTLSWTGEVGAHFDVVVNRIGGGSQVLVKDTGTSTTITIAELFAEVDFTTEGTAFDIHVRSKLPDGSLPSGFSAAVQITIVGFPVPTNLAII